MSIFLLNLLFVSIFFTSIVVPNTFHQLFTKRINKYSLRSDNYTEPRKKTKLTQFAISYRGPHLWNVILKDQAEIKKLTSPNSFKYKVKDLLLSIDLDNLLNFFLKKTILFLFFPTLTKTRHCPSLCQKVLDDKTADVFCESPALSYLFVNITS